MRKVTLPVKEGDEGKRLDVFVSREVAEVSRTLVGELIKEGRVKVDGEAKKPSYHLKAGEVVEVEVPTPKEIELLAQEIPLPIVYEDEDVLVIDKPRGMVVHPACGNWDSTLVNALLYWVRDLSGINGELRPGIVHRLDKDTSGLMVVAKNDRAHRHLAEQIKKHEVHREYIALVHGVVPHQRGRVVAPVGRDPKNRKRMAVVPEGKEAVTNYEVLARYEKYTLVKCLLETGRTHQIRVHMSYLGHPVVGDPLYGPASNEFGQKGQLLHAQSLSFVHPSTGEHMTFKAPLPDYFQAILLRLQDRTAANKA